jgi:hypothetical protein
MCYLSLEGSVVQRSDMYITVVEYAEITRGQEIWKLRCFNANRIDLLYDKRSKPKGSGPSRSRHLEV